MGLLSSRSSSSTSTTNNLYDQRSVNDAGGGVIGSGSITASDDDTTFIDSSNRSVTTINATDPGALNAAYWISANNAAFLTGASENLNSSARALGGLAIGAAESLAARSGADSRALGQSALSEAGSLGRYALSAGGTLGQSALSEAGSLGRYALSAAGTLGGQVTDLYRTAGSNSAQAWSATLGASERLTSRLLDQVGRTTDAAAGVASSAVRAFTPTENLQADAGLKLGMIAAALAAAFLLLRKG